MPGRTLRRWAGGRLAAFPVCLPCLRAVCSGRELWQCHRHHHSACSACQLHVLRSTPFPIPLTHGIQVGDRAGEAWDEVKSTGQEKYSEGKAAVKVGRPARGRVMLCVGRGPGAGVKYGRGWAWGWSELAHG